MKPLYFYYRDKLFRTAGFFLFILFSLLSCATTYLMATGYVGNSTPATLTVVQLIANIGYGYVAGYIFYIASDFFINVRSRYGAMQKIILNERYLLMNAISLSTIPLLGASSADDISDNDRRKAMLISAMCQGSEEGGYKTKKCADCEAYYILGPYKDLIEMFALKSKVFLNNLQTFLAKDLSNEEIESINEIKEFMFFDHFTKEGNDYIAGDKLIVYSYNQLVEHTHKLCLNLDKRLKYCASEDDVAEISEMITGFKIEEIDT